MLLNLSPVVEDIKHMAKVAKKKDNVEKIALVVTPTPSTTTSTGSTTSPTPTTAATVVVVAEAVVVAARWLNMYRYSPSSGPSLDELYGDWFEDRVFYDQYSGSYNGPEMTSLERLLHADNNIYCPTTFTVQQNEIVYK
jgi:hypothetical protein